MATPQFSIRLDDYTLRCIDYIASDYDVPRSMVIQWACTAYIELVKANEARVPSKSEMSFILDHIRLRSGKENHDRVVQFSAVAETPHEPGKITDPAAAGGAEIAQNQKYPRAKRGR